MRMYHQEYVDVERDGEEDTIEVSFELDYWPATFSNPAELSVVNTEARWVDSTPYGTPLTDAEWEQYETEIEDAIHNS